MCFCGQYSAWDIYQSSKNRPDIKLKEQEKIPERDYEFSSEAT